MSWYRVDDKSHSHVKILEAGNAAWGAHVRMGAWSKDHGTDGRIPIRVALHFAAEAELAALVRVGLAHRTVDGYELHDFLDWQDSAEEQRRAIEKKKKAGRFSGRSRREHNANTCSPSVQLPDEHIANKTRTRGLGLDLGSGSDPEGGAGGPPGDHPPPASSTHPTPPPPANDRESPPDPEERYRRAYVAGIEAGTGRGYAFPSGLRDQGALNASLPAHGRDLDGTPHTGLKLLAWITHKAGEYARWVGRLEDDERKFWPLAPSGWARWLNDGRDRPAKPPRPTAPYHAPAKRAWAEPAPEERITAAQVAELSAVVGRGGAR